MELKRTIAVGALAALAAGGIGVGTALASPASNNPAVGVAPAAFTDTAPQTAEQPGYQAGNRSDKPDSDKAEEGSDKPDPGETSGGPDTDNIQHEGTGNEGDHADEPGARSEGK